MGEFLPTCIPVAETSQSASDTSVSRYISFSCDLFWWPLTSTLYTAHTWSYPDLIVKRKWRAANFVSCNEFTWWQSSVMPISVMGEKKSISIVMFCYLCTRKLNKWHFKCSLWSKNRMPYTETSIQLSICDIVSLITLSNWFFDVLLTMQLRIILVINWLNAQKLVL